MARSHHRKKHKSHLKQFQSHQQTDRVRNRKTTGTLAVIGIILGLAVGYFGSGSDPVWIAVGGVIGGFIGYITGRILDRDVN